MYTYLAVVTSDPAYLQGILLTVLGVVGTYLIQGIKKLVGVGGRPAIILTAIISGILALGVLYFTGGITNINDVVGSSGVIFSLATIAYRFLLAGETPATDKTPAV